jgi:hypothetical protein
VEVFGQEAEGMPSVVIVGIDDGERAVQQIGAAPQGVAGAERLAATAWRLASSGDPIQRLFDEMQALVAYARPEPF